MRTHELKTWPEYFVEIAAGRKTFEIRNNDRAFRVGDVLVLREWNPDAEVYTDREERREVSYILEHRPPAGCAATFGLQPGYVILGLIPIRASAPEPLSQWTDRDMLIGGTRYKAGSITIADVLDHAARASGEFYADDDELSEEDRHMVDRAWEKHKAATPPSTATSAVPVAWRWHPNGNPHQGWTYTQSKNRVKWCEMFDHPCEPLYATPTPSDAMTDVTEREAAESELIAAMLYEAANPTMKWSYLWPSHNHLHASVRQRYMEAAARFEDSTCPSPSPSPSPAAVVALRDARSWMTAMMKEVPTSAVAHAAKDTIARIDAALSASRNQGEAGVPAQFGDQGETK